MGYVKPLYQAASTINFSNVSEEKKKTVITANSDIPCASECVAEIYKAIYEATTSAQTISYQNPQPPIQSSNSSSNRQYSISLGTGINATTTWTNVPGAQTYINSANYGNIQSVTFQASLFVPTGNQVAYVQLYNVTDNHPVWFTTMSMSGGQPQLLISSPISLDSGNKLYQVQMMSQLGFQTNLVESSVNIISN